MREIALWPFTNGAIVRFLVLPGSLLSITEITEYIYFSPLKLSCELKYKIERKCCTTASYHWTHFVFVKHNMYILLHACSAQCDFSIYGRILSHPQFSSRSCQFPAKKKGGQSWPKIVPGSGSAVQKKSYRKSSTFQQLSTNQPPHVCLQKKLR